MTMAKAKQVQNSVADRVRWVFGDVAETILRTEEKKFGTPLEKLSSQEISILAEDLKELSLRMAGPELANRVYDAVLTSLSEKRTPKR